MRLAEGSIRRPVATTLLMLAILLFGLVAYRQLPVRDLPNVDFPTILVFASLPGASPETMASSVATPLERQFSTIAGVDSMTSTNTRGGTSITLQFHLDRDIDAAAQDVQAAISLAIRFLPKNMPTPPSFRKVNPADQPVPYLAMTGGGVDLDDIEPLFSEAFVSPDKPLPADPAGVARLTEALAAVAAPPAPKPVASPPAIAERISGRTFVFDPNPLEIEACSLDLTPDPAVAVFRITHDGGKTEPWPVGLDGVYRMSEGEFGLPQGLRGGWLDDRTFALEYDNIGNNDHVLLRLSFAGDRVTVESRETAHELGARFEGRAVRR